jgi:imidazolonepropionase-like amidohydrolase
MHTPIHRLIVVGLCALSTLVFAGQSGDKVQLVIRGGTLIPMVSDKPETVGLKAIVINAGKIDRIITSSDATPVPAADQTIDATSLFILPGLIDSHVHFRDWFPEPTLRYGVTTVMDTGPCGNACPEDPNEYIKRKQRALNDGQVKGPSLYVTGMKLNKEGYPGEPERHTWYVKSLDDLVQKIEILDKVGVDALKAEEGLPVDYRRRLIQEAEKRNLPVVGHSRDARESISVGMRFIEHMYPIAMSLSGNPASLERGNEYLMDLTKAPELIDLMVREKVYLNPTLVGGFQAISDRQPRYKDENAKLLAQPMFQVIPADRRADIQKSISRAEALPPEKRKQLQESYRKVQTFLREFDAKGGRVLAASDASTDSMPGLATHREMQLITDAGIPPYRALLGATRWPAELLRKPHIGTIGAGKQADVLIVAANPVTDIAATQQVRYVIRKGKIERRPDPQSQSQD